jgi:hypothetical protein
MFDIPSTACVLGVKGDVVGRRCQLCVRHSVGRFNCVLISGGLEDVDEREFLERYVVVGDHRCSEGLKDDNPTVSLWAGSCLHRVVYPAV